MPWRITYCGGAAVREENKKKLMIIDDDAELVEDLKEAFEARGYTVVGITDPKEALYAIYKEDPDLIILDIMMPDITGWEICSRVREFSSVPIIMLTAKITDEDKVRGLELGADDYVTKPFNLEELALRVKRVLERAELQPHYRQEPVLTVGNLKVDFVNKAVFKGGKRVNLSVREQKLFFYLIRNRGRTVPYERILSVVWGEEWKDDKNVLKAYIYRLRSKIEDDPQSPRLIVAERGIGYRFEAEPQKDEAEG